MEITSPSFVDGGLIPSKYTCDGQDVSPELTWRDIPQQTKSFALICDDPDAPRGTWTHWVLYNIPPTTLTLAENIISLPTGTIAGITSAKERQYGGPCPPSGVHRYFFTIYALDTMLNAKDVLNSNTLQSAMQGHTLAKAVLMGRYSRNQ